MGVLRTIVATAVIVFALTTVAMGGVQHFTKQGGETAVQAQQPSYTVTLTDKQLAKLLAASKQAANHDQTVRHTAKQQRRHVQKQSRNTQHVYAATHTTYRASQSSGSGTRSGYRCPTTHNDCWGHSSGHSGTSHSGSHSGGGCCD